MRFSTTPVNRITRLFAGVIVLAMSLGLAAQPVLIVRIAGIALFVLALSAVCAGLYQMVGAFLRRQNDPYDLSKLWEAPLPDESPRSEHHEPLAKPLDAESFDAKPLDAKPLDTEPLDDDLLYCHRCGASMSRRFAVCPDCGHRLGY